MNTRAITVFLGLAFGLAYLIDAIIAATGSLGTALGLTLTLLRMLTPLAATLIVCRWVTREPWAQTVGLGRDTFVNGRWRWPLGYSALGIVLVLLAVFLALGAAIFSGWLHPDWAMTTTMDALRNAGAGAIADPSVFLLLQIVQGVVFGATLNALFALGEEVGWRGWLHTALRPLGTPRLILITGVVWGLWHAPLIAMGYNYDQQLHPVLAVGLFTLFCIAFGAVLTWLREASASVIPAAVAHGVFNALSPLPLLLVAPGKTLDLALAGPVGLAATVLFVAVAAVAWSAGRRRVVKQPA